MRELVKQLKRQPKEIVINDDSSDSLIAKNITSMSSNFCEGTQMLYYTSNLGGSFELDYEVGSSYSWMEYTGFTYSGVSVSDEDSNPLTSFSITSKNLNVTIINSGNNIKLSAVVNVEASISVGGWGVKIADYSVTTNKTWSTSELPYCA